MALRTFMQVNADGSNVAWWGSQNFKTAEMKLNSALSQNRKSRLASLTV